MAYKGVKEADLFRKAADHKAYLKHDHGVILEAKTYFAYGAYGYVYNYRLPNDDKQYQVATSMGTKNECAGYMDDAYRQIVSIAKEAKTEMIKQCIATSQDLDEIKRLAAEL